MYDAFSITTSSNNLIKTLNEIKVWPLIAEYCSSMMEHVIIGFSINLFWTEVSSASGDTFIFPVYLSNSLLFGRYNGEEYTSNNLLKTRHVET